MKVLKKITEEKKKDYTFRKRLSLESKNTLSTSNSWTGNGYPKCNWHILFKYDFNKDGIIDLSEEFDVSEEIYYNKMDAIKDNLERTKKMEILEDFIWENYLS